MADRWTRLVISQALTNIKKIQKPWNCSFEIVEHEHSHTLWHVNAKMCHNDCERIHFVWSISTTAIIIVCIDLQKLLSRTKWWWRFSHTTLPPQRQRKRNFPLNIKVIIFDLFTNRSIRAHNEYDWHAISESISHNTNVKYARRWNV